MLRSLTTHSLLLEAKRRRALGDYSRTTLGLYAKAWQTSQTPRSLLHYCLFLHELGYTLPKALRFSLTEAQAKLAEKQRRLAAAMLNESRRDCQADLHTEFAAWLRGAAAQTIAVIGNGANLLGSRRAADIEHADCVVRFNHWRAAPEDVGRRTDLWVRSPLDIRAAESPTPTPSPRWVAVSGPEMSARKPEWDDWGALNGGRLLSFPLQVWRPLVKALGAPPSAGLLTLGWLRAIRKSWDGIEVFGIGYAGGRYHAAKKNHRPSHRHRWHKEAEVLRGWAAGGLVVNGLE
jgi:hypothetical protein